MVASASCVDTMVRVASAVTLSDSVFQNNATYASKHSAAIMLIY
jgi:hypothetical protein